MVSILPCSPDKAYGLGPDAVQSEQNIKILRKVEDRPVSGAQQSARSRSPDPNPVEIRSEIFDRLPTHGATQSHTSPELVDAALYEFARCLRPGGGLAIGFFEGPELVAFDRAVAAAYYWPLDLLSARLSTCGFSVIGAATRTEPGVRRQGLITAERS